MAISIQGQPLRAFITLLVAVALNASAIAASDALSRAFASLPLGKKQWSEIEKSPKFLELDDGDKETVRQSYFERVLSPHIVSAELQSARETFARLTGSKVRNAWGPNGEPWPDSAAYLRPLPRLRTGGLSSVTIDNSRGGFNTYVKLCPVVPGKCHGFRHVYVPDGSVFTLDSVSPGAYEVRYQDVATKQSARSEPISLEQRETETGTSFSKVRLTLFKVKDGNMKFSSIPPDEF